MSSGYNVKKLNFACMCDSNYLSRLHVLINSINENVENWNLFLLCLDDEIFRRINNEFPQNVICIKLRDIEQRHEILIRLKPSRSKVEYYFTLSPFLPIYIFSVFNVDHICTLDTDIRFYSNPCKIFDQLTSKSVIITPHNFSSQLHELYVYGKFNVSFQIFKNDKIGNLCLSNWKKMCLNWCYDYLNEKTGWYADQKYLDDWEVLYGDKLLILDGCTSGLAPWNVDNYTLELDDGRLKVNSKNVVFYHFHGFKYLGYGFYSNGFEAYKIANNKAVLLRLYQNYLRENNKAVPGGLKSIRGIQKSLIESLIFEKSVFYYFCNRLFFVINPNVSRRLLKVINYGKRD